MFSSSASQVVSATQAEAIDFDGTNDYLSRSSDLTGNADGKTFTFSAWVWVNSSGTSQYLLDAYTTGHTFRGFSVTVNVTGNIVVSAAAVGGASLVLNAQVANSATSWMKDTFFHLLISVDLANAANRSIYVNDVLQTVTWTTYTNANIDFTATTWASGATAAGFGNKYIGRLSNVFLDYTYRDLSVTANRRLFVTADLKPASGQAALNPILYLPMNDPTAPGTNAGTGGNFTLTGTVARSGRGPNQYNAPYSDLDGTADYLSRTIAPTGITDSKTFTFAFAFNTDTIGNTRLFTFATAGSNRFTVTASASGMLEIRGFNAAGSLILTADTTTAFVVSRNYHVVVSIDLADTGRRHVYVNGQAASVTWNTYTNDTIQFAITTTPTYHIGASATPSQYFNGRLGALWFNTSYIDLSVAGNLAKFVTGTGIDAKPVDLGASGELPTGTSPLIYLPMYGNNAGKNYGTGGDFTVNSGPYTGARGPNEFWGNKADFNGTTGYLARTSALSGVSDGKVVSGCLWINVDATTGTLFQIASDAGIKPISISISGGTLSIQCRRLDNSGDVLVATRASAVVAATTYCLMFCFDLTDTAKRFVYLNGALQSMTWTTYLNENLGLSTTRSYIGANWNGTAINDFTDGRIAELYFTTQYIDFSQEANRLLFRDAFDNPTNLPALIAAGTVPNPAIYMRFPPTAFGTNSGTGGNFTVNGTITDGGNL